jgi:iron-sulfur cluster assembly accessory protein
MLCLSVTVLGIGCNARPAPAPKADSRTPPAQVDSGTPVAKPEAAVNEAPFVTVTPRAATQVRLIIAGNFRKESQTAPVYLRLRVLPGGCTGFLHKLDLDPVASSATDQVCESGGIKVVIWKSQVEFLRGATVDYGEKNGQTGFMIQNPNVEGVAEKNWLPKLLASVPENERPKAPPPSPAAERIAQFQKMTADDPDNELAHYRLGQLLMEDDQYAEAVKSFERTLELSPQFTKVYQLLGECLIELDRKDRAVEVLTKGWAVADKRGDDMYRDEMAKLLTELGAPVPKK